MLFVDLFLFFYVLGGVAIYYDNYFKYYVMSLQIYRSLERAARVQCTPCTPELSEITLENT